MGSSAGPASPLHAAPALRYTAARGIAPWELIVIFAGAYAVGHAIIQRKKHRAKEREDKRERARQKRARNPLRRFFGR